MKQELKDLIHSEIRKRIGEATALRHRFHQIPEKAFEEKKTAELIVSELKKMGIPFQEGVAGTGIVATIDGKRPGKVIALRADMDALDIEDETAKPYTSFHKGLSHSCGHDGHIVCILEATRILSFLHEYLAGTVRVIFQPGEEIGLGAKAMIGIGALGNPLPSAIFALHSWPNLESGVVATMPGRVTSINDRFDITIKGRGGHGARPHESISPIIIAAQIVQQISNLTNTGNNGKFPCVVSVGILQGGTKANVIPDNTIIKGTIRSYHELTRMELLDRFQKTVQNICKKEKAEAIICLHGYCPSVINHPALYDLFEKVSEELLIPEKQACIPIQSMGSEDFGHYTQHIPGLLIRLGMGVSSHKLHTGKFDFCDESIETGITVLVGLAMLATENDFTIETRENDDSI